MFSYRDLVRELPRAAPHPETLERDMNAMRFRAKHVSASENGDYYQVAFENRDAASDAADVYPDSPYLLIQRQFEDPDGGKCYVRGRIHGAF